MISAFGLTDRGILRRENQDALRFEVLDNDRAWGVVCDGMGGAKAGDVASRIAVDVFQEHMEAFHSRGDQKEAIAALQAAVEEGNQLISKRALHEPDCQGMGTTLVGAIFQGGRAYVVNIGDSRAYLISRDDMRQVTRDHSLVEALVERGNITPAEARRHPQKNLITRALGTGRNAQADLFELSLSPGQWLLLCSDGLINEMGDEEMAGQIREGDTLEACCKGLLDTVLTRGAPDNVTILLFHLEEQV